MNWLDIVIIVAILVPGLIGYKTGLIKTAFLFAAFFLGALISSKYPILPTSFLEKNIVEPKMRYLINFAATFLLVFVGVNLIGAMFYRLISFTPLKLADKWVGTGLGFLAGIIFAGFIVTYMAGSDFGDSRELLEKSLLAPILRDMFGQIFPQKEYETDNDAERENTKPDFYIINIPPLHPPPQASLALIREFC